VTKSTLPFGWYFITDLRLGYTDTTYIIENLVKVLRGHVGRKSSRATDKKVAGLRTKNSKIRERQQ
ncbi:MAG: hypothetical protein ACK5GN_01430, partial [Pseudomonadota bacterium]